MKQNINVEAEGSELILRNKAGDHVIIPKKHRLEVQDMIKEGCHNCIDALVDTLPVMEDYAEDGTMIPQDPPKGDNIIFSPEDIKKIQDTIRNMAQIEEKGKDVYEHYVRYINSPMYKERWINMEGSKDENDNEGLFSAHKNKVLSALAKTKIDYYRGDENESGSFYDAKRRQISIDIAEGEWKNKINLSDPDDSFIYQRYTPEQIAPIIAHEYSHAIDYTDNYDWLISPYNDYREIVLAGKTRFNAIRENMNYTPELNPHDKSTAERVADLRAVRYILGEEKIYDAGTQVFTREHLDKMKGLNYFEVKRMFQLHSDDDIIYLMNVIAKDDTSESDNII